MDPFILAQKQVLGVNVRRRRLHPHAFEMPPSPGAASLSLSPDPFSPDSSPPPPPPPCSLVRLVWSSLHPEKRDEEEEGVLSTYVVRVHVRT